MALLASACGARPADPGFRLDSGGPRFDALVPPGSRLDTIATGFTWVEGPAWDRRSNALLFSDVPGNRVMRWTEAGGTVPHLFPSGYSGRAPFTGREPGSNGLAFDAEGRLLLCEHGDRRVTRLEADGSRTVLADRYQGRRFNSPNDLVLSPEGDVYFTDPPFGLPKTFRDPGRELAGCGVYRRAPDGTISLVTQSLGAPNGVALSPDGRTLYVSNSEAKRPVILAIERRPDGTTGAERLFFDATPFMTKGAGVPDGLKVDRAGHLFATGPGGLFVLAPDGTLLGRLRFDTPVSNCAFGGDGRDLYLTAGSAVHRLRLVTSGFAEP